MSEPEMRTGHDIRSMIDYLSAKDAKHPDLVAFRWMLGERLQPEDTISLNQHRTDMDDLLARMGAERNRLSSDLRMATDELVKQRAVIEDLKEKLARFVTPPMRMDA